MADLPCGIPRCGLAEGEIPQGKGMRIVDFKLKSLICSLFFQAEIQNYQCCLTPTLPSLLSKLWVKHYSIWLDER